MAKKIDRNWNKGRIHIWKKDAENTSYPPPQPPPPPPPPLLPPPPPLRTSYHRSHFPPPIHQTDRDETRHGNWNGGSQNTNCDSSCYDEWEQNEEQNSGKDFEARIPERHRQMSSLLRLYEGKDHNPGMVPYGQQVPLTATMQEKTKDTQKRYPPHGKDDGRERLPPPPPRLDFPIETRIAKPQYRRVDEYDEDPRLRAELYPLEDELARKEVQGTSRQAPETIEILPERNIKHQETSELNLVPTQTLKQEYGAESYKMYSDHGYKPERWEKEEGHKKETFREVGEIIDDRRTKRQISYPESEKYVKSNSQPPRRESFLFGKKTHEKEDPYVRDSRQRTLSRKPLDDRDYQPETEREYLPYRSPEGRVRIDHDRERYVSLEDEYQGRRHLDENERRASKRVSYQEDNGRGVTSLERTRNQPHRRRDEFDTGRLSDGDEHNTDRTANRGSLADRNIYSDDYGDHTVHRSLPVEDRNTPIGSFQDQKIRSWVMTMDNIQDLSSGKKKALMDELTKKIPMGHDTREPSGSGNYPKERSEGRFTPSREDYRDIGRNPHLVDDYDYYREPLDRRREPSDELKQHKTSGHPVDRNLEGSFPHDFQDSKTDRRSMIVDYPPGQSVERRKPSENGRGNLQYERKSELIDNGRESYERKSFRGDETRRGTHERIPTYHSDGEGKLEGHGVEGTKSPPLIPHDSLRHRSGGELNKLALTGTKSLAPYELLKEDDHDIPVGKRDSVTLPVLEESEKEFHELVAAGNVAAVRAFLNDNPHFNINCVNYQKISALHVAVHEQNEAMVDFLLGQPSLDCSDCALYAIKEGNVRIVEKIMDKIRETSPGLEFAATTHSVDFPDDMTPIILAAQLGNYEIIDFLIKREHIIPPVHNPYCKCEACKADLQKYDRLKYSTMKLNLYKAICNPMYIFHVTDDPFQKAFDLTQELQDAAKVFPQFKTSYEELWKELRNFTVDLIGCCRNAQEVEIILKKSANNIAGSITFPRLQYAIDLKQKEFVSHPYTQAVLVDAWTGDLLEWKVRSPLMQALSVFPRIPMLPVMAVMCMFLPNHKLVKKWKTPVNKMISSVASYIIFLIVLFLESNLDKRNQKRGPPNSGLEGLIIVYVIGYIWLNIRVCFRLGPKRFFSTMWHWYDCIMLFLFTMTIIFWIASLADVTANNEIDLPRKYWNALDPELIAEGFFAAAVIMAFFRLNMFLSLNYHLGPLQVSIGKMTLDIFRFIIIFFIIIIAWCAGLCRFYQPYDGMVQKDATSGSSTTQVSSFVSFSMTLKTFFWAIFGMSPIESADVVIENLPGDTPETTIINHHDFTEAVGYIAFALFQFLSVVVVLNMLVACMANTFTKVIDNVTVEWVFGRSQIYLSFMAASTLPPPFNLLPTAGGIKSTCLWLKLLAKPSGGKRAKCNISHCCYIESETEAYVNTEFPSLMSELAQRYLRLKTESVETHDDLEELKGEVKELLRKVDKITALRKCL